VHAAELADFRDEPQKQSKSIVERGPKFFESADLRDLILRINHAKEIRVMRVEEIMTKNVSVCTAISRELLDPIEQVAWA
jgi:hypothetical protein